jgi:hypothetical protein
MKLFDRNGHYTGGNLPALTVPLDKTKPPFPEKPTVGIITTLWSYYDFLPGWCESIKKLNRQPDRVVIAAHDAQKVLSIAKPILNTIEVVQVDESFNFSNYLNKAIETCDTDWVAWIGVDDRYRPHAFDEIDKIKSDILVFGMRYDDTGNEWHYRNDLHNCLHYDPVPCGSPFRRWIWERVPFQNQLTPFEDWGFWAGAHVLGATAEGTNGRVDFDYACHPDQIIPPFGPNATKVRNWAVNLAFS